MEIARRNIEAHLLLPIELARHAATHVNPAGTLLFMGGTPGRNPLAGFSLVSAMTAALPALVRNLALEIAPVRVNVIAAGFVDTPLSEALLGSEIEARREELRQRLPIGRVIKPVEIAELAVDMMLSTAVTGATFDIDGGQQLVKG
jgi:NAD(P)-dependent dehydrogenase (short-subunit alcohol dehydrogenase family)